MKKLLSILSGPWTHSRLADFEACKFRFHLKHVAKRPEGPPSPALARGQEVHENIEAYLNNWIKTLIPGILLRKEIAALKKKKPTAEKLWAHASDYSPMPDPFAKSAYVRAKLDAMLETNDRVRVIDFKTGRVYPGNDDQVRFYAMLGLKRSKRDLAQTELWYVDQDLIKECDPVTRAEVPTLEKDYTRRAGRMYKEFEAKPEPGLHCRTCPYRKGVGGPCPY